MRSKEFGSDFHRIDEGVFRNLNTPNEFITKVDQLFFSGRAALYHIIRFGIERDGWKKLFVPTYYCHEVYHFLKNLAIEIVFYQYNPIENKVVIDIEDVKTNVLLSVNYFGVQTPTFKVYENVQVIEDLTHDLSKIDYSTAHYVFGSLRKILPLAVGGFLKSNTEKLPQINLENFADEAAAQKSAAMYLKSEYLKDKFENKDTFRQLFLNAEELFEENETYSNLPLETETFLCSLNVDAICDQKKKNINLFKQLILPNPYFEIVTTLSNTDFSLILKCKTTDIRNRLRQNLIVNQIFPMVLWPNQITDEDKIVEEILLFIHADFRYNEDDIQFMSTIINQFIKSQNV